MPALYTDLLRNFLEINPEQLLGRLTGGLAIEGFDTTLTNTFSWQSEIAELQLAFGRLVAGFPQAAPWQILFEYVLPIVGQRVDCVLLAEDIIYVIEYKGGSSTTGYAALRQAQEYALNLADFHEASRHRIAIPIAVGAFPTLIPLDVTSEHGGAAVASEDLSDVILSSFRLWGAKATPIQPVEWNTSRYFPVPTIVQAASAIYHNHDVKELAYSRAGTENLEVTQETVARSVRDARQRGIKMLLIITGVPGAGKTLAGLNAVQLLAQDLDPDIEQASFLSGNGPLVAVLQEALRRSVGSRKKGTSRSVRSRVREVHRFVRDSYDDSRPPADRLIVFDEAQRAWTAKKNLKKFARDISEPEMILEIMGRHVGWAVIVALVGGGQEIHGGEAGLAAWGDAIRKHPEWEVITSPEAMLGGASVAGSRLFREDCSDSGRVKHEPSLHLSVSKRSFETEVTAAWVNAMLDGCPDEARVLACKGLPIYLTRDLAAARSWLGAMAKGDRRAGLIASSGAARLRAEGVETPTFDFSRGIDYVKWFLELAGDHRSSNQLEVALSEFEMQGLEIDVAGLLWGGDLIFPAGKVIARTLRGRKWCTVSGTGDPQASAEDPRTRIQNKYRVLLTRFRKGMVIFVPMGSTEDMTRTPADFDGVYEYLVRCGVEPLEERSSVL
jgi:hypothetical protein